DEVHQETADASQKCCSYQDGPGPETLIRTVLHQYFTGKQPSLEYVSGNLTSDLPGEADIPFCISIWDRIWKREELS
ncbi:MAG: hypothetical protein IKD69_04250, partial [Solobacterium sp.]|nr:hypothetical protein [Solobacterium sp.]